MTGLKRGIPFAVGLAVGVAIACVVMSKHGTGRNEEDNPSLGKSPAPLETPHSRTDEERSNPVCVMVLGRECPPGEFEGNAHEFLAYLHSIQPKIMSPERTDFPIGSTRIVPLEKAPKRPRVLRAKMNLTGKSIREAIEAFAAQVELKWRAIVYPDGRIDLVFIWEENEQGGKDQNKSSQDKPDG